MKLAQIFMSREAWQRMSSLKMPPHTAGKLFKYTKLVDVELELIEAQRTPLVKEAIEKKHARLDQDEKAKESEVKLGQYDGLRPADPEFAEFWSLEKFGAVLDTESDLKPFSMSLDSILDLASKEQANALSAQDLGQLEPFFEVAEAK